jgi:hypothetical protein
MKTTSSSHKKTQFDDLKIVNREAGESETPEMPLLHGLKRLMNTIMTKGGRQIYGSTQFWKDLSLPLYGHTKAWWPAYLPPTFVSRCFSAEPMQVVSHVAKAADIPMQLEFDM